MGDLEEALNRNYLLVDTWDVRHQQALLLGITMIIFTIFGTFLILLCSTPSSLMTTILLLIMQIGLGIPATRAYYEFGLSTRGKLKFFDSALLGDNGDRPYDLVINIGEVPLLFEKMDATIQRYDREKIDDLNDIAWFVVLVWAIISSALYFIGFSNLALCSLGVFVLLSACIACYLSGFWTHRGTSFQDDLDHLEYYVEYFTRNLDDVYTGRDDRMILRLIDLRRKSVLVDLALEFNPHPEMTIEYHFGLSSSLLERFILEIPSQIIDTIYKELKNCDAILSSGWELEQITTQSGAIIRLVNTNSKLNIANRFTYVTGPSVIENSCKITKTLLTQIASILENFAQR